jgi:hypothetical protein
MLDGGSMSLFDELNEDLSEAGARCVGPVSGFHDQRAYNGI